MGCSEAVAKARGEAAAAEVKVTTIRATAATAWRTSSSGGTGNDDLTAGEDDVYSDCGEVADDLYDSDVTDATMNYEGDDRETCAY